MKEFLGRIPKFVLFGAAGLIQVGFIALMVLDRINILRTGTDVMLQTQPLDPRDFLRGDYVILGYDISTLPAGALKDQPAAGKGTPIFVKLAPKADGFYEAVSVSTTPVAVTAPDVLIRGRVTSGTNCGADRREFCPRCRSATELNATSSRRERVRNSKMPAMSESSRSSLR